MNYYVEDLKYKKQDKDKIKAEINDLQTRIVVATGHRDRYEVNNIRERINFLKRKLKDLNQEIYDLEKKLEFEMVNKMENNLVEINGVDLLNTDLNNTKRGEVTVKETKKFNFGNELGQTDDGRDYIQRGQKTVTKTTKYRQGRLVYEDEVVVEIIEGVVFDNLDCVDTKLIK